MTSIPQAAPQRRIARYLNEIEQQLGTVLRGRQYIQGTQVASFEDGFASYLGVEFAIGVNSGTDAVALALRAAGVGRGDEVITTTMTAAGTAIGILQSGATPRLVDIDPVSRNFDLDAVEAAVTPRTAAIVPVHLHGVPCDMDRLTSIARKHHLLIIEDCAQAHGATWSGQKVGSFGIAGAFSFYPTKNLGCVGDGGMVVTDDPLLADKVRELRQYGWSMNTRTSKEFGCNSRLDEMQAAILNVLLGHLDEGNRERREIARRYSNGLQAAEQNGCIKLPPLVEGAVFHQFAIECDDRAGVVTELDREGIATGSHYSEPLHRQPLFASFVNGPFPIAERFAAQNISLPIQGEVAGQHVDHITRSLTRSLTPRRTACNVR